MLLRRAVDSDALDVLMWRNDPQAIAMSGTPAAVSPDEHCRWFEKSLANPDRLMFIGVVGTEKIGVVRFDKTGESWTVSVNVAPSERGKGYGNQLVRSGILRLSDYVGHPAVVAKVKEDNLASIRVFERCGFQRVGEGGGWLHYVRH